ncbi:symmetrical bis(5'-nucleosyl)-tetraphosphatase [Salinisphaera sp. Q1T1-3]|uniref:symmetrical bis(5'-nucleosyl)-tetraphosphatase n=1 Tax=Salinisphaera sp. Q1T1-3 TaxID=2321229 RepID=UPI000E728113|nr:symmetrical bis(5'-nucleosyl)-tetraphosphatase [Salinisphaera sp. Q1T1-3]RJS94004.1 symmetrical bis(5'-nucleosyl)-tetraphosphatase [Salinisphaera sp. Q1T1-3]
MATYAIGDIHGARATLEALLDKLAARGPIDALWFVGDLVNRGPDSAGVIRRIRALGDRAITVLGNHDLALLALAQRPDPKQKANRSLHDLLDAPDRDDLLDWLRHRPLTHHDATLGWTMVHAGFAPEWDLAAAHAGARELETVLRSRDHARFLQSLFGDTPAQWSDDLTGDARLRFIANALTRIRFVDAEGRLDMKYKKTIAGAPDGLLPWFQIPTRRSAGTPLVFGHWSALEDVAWPTEQVYGIDTGAAWGGQLTALQLDAPPEADRLIQVDSA